MNFNHGSRPVVDAAFLALAIVRAPTELWTTLDARTQQRVIAALQSSRVIQPGYSNWLLFSAMVEAALSFMGVWWDPMRVDYAIRTVDTMRLQTIPATRHKKLDEGQRLRLRSCRRLPPAALTPHT